MLDVKTTFLHRDIEEEIYMVPSEGFAEKGKENLVFRLNKSLYGLKQVPSLWTNILKVDLQKASDHVDWDFLHEVLYHLNFPPQFVGWIMECVTTNSYSISLNGKLNGFVVGKRGLRKGDHLSSFLFTLCFEMLLRSLNHMSFSFCLTSTEDVISSALHIYADELLLFSKGNAGVDELVKELILDITGFNIGHVPFRYLGIPLAPSRLRTSDYSILVDAINAKIRSRPRNYLSYAGKFVWPTKHPPISWNMSYKLKDDGTMGLKNLMAWNFLLKNHGNLYEEL
ncbi:uncharacterized protein LOC142532356 [Primulina tabacum]|uniref:uncharacterized protein LOC142532356 n=1 Tax=Primulina tabacum TaxID=48773 RepID=UPI003F5A734F